MRALLASLLLFSAVGCRYPNADERFLTDADHDGFVEQVDCDDSDADVNPEADESCNDVDDDCDETIDEDPVDPSSFWVDSDADGYGDDDLATVQGCVAPTGYAAEGGDCDDDDKDFHPGALDIVGDGVDQDCNGHDTIPCAVDADHDGYGSTSLVTVLADDGSCDTAQGEAPDHTDCLDNDPNSHPGATEVPGDQIDQDCSGADAPPCWTDTDGDGFGNPAAPLIVATCDGDHQADNDDDCLDSNAATYPGATELCDGLDNDCDLSSADEIGQVSFQPLGGGAWVDATAAVKPGSGRGAYSASTSGSLWLCEGAYYATITVPTTISSFTIEGRGGAEKVFLSGADGPAGDPAARAIVTTGAESGSLTIRGLAIGDATTTENGGAIFLAGTPTQSVIDACVIQQSTATLAGGGLYVSGGSVSVTDTIFTVNSAGTDGGNVAVAGGTVTFDADSVIEEGTAQRGGGIFVNAGTTTIAGMVTYNDATGGGDESGGGIYLAAGSLVLSGAEVSNNTSVLDGAGVYARAGSTGLTLTTADVFSNDADRDGGGVYSAATTLTTSGSLLDDNDASHDTVPPTVGRGGGLFLAAGTMTATGTTTITDNTAAMGGGFYQLAGATTITNLQASGNTQAGGNALGGGALAMKDGTLTVTGGLIEDNHANGNDGGALLMDAPTSSASPASATFIGATIQNNTALDEGGAIACFNACNVTVTDTFVIGNTAEDSGAVDFDTTGGVFTCFATTADTAGILGNVATGAADQHPPFAGGVRMVDGAAISSTRCNWGTGTSENVLGVTAIDVSYGTDGIETYGGNATFTCAWATGCVP